MVIILSKIAGIFIVMLLGLLINKAKVIPGEANHYFVTLLLWITTPCMIYCSITSREYDPSILSSTIHMFVIGVAFFLLAVIIGFALAKYVLKVPEKDLGIYVASFGGINNGFMGFPITLALFGNNALYYMVIFNIALNIYMYSACPIIMGIGHDTGKFNVKYIFKTLANPSTIICVVSMVMLVKGWNIPDVLFESVEMVGDITVPLSMLVVGMQLGESNALKVLKNRKLMLFSVIKMISLPVLVFLLVNWLPVITAVKIAAVIGATFPCAVVVSAIALMENRNSILASEMVAITTFLSVITIPIVSLLLGGYYGV